VTTDPIRKQLQVRIAPERAFRLFTAEMGSWWPLDTHSRADDDQTTKDVVFEEETGGRIYEIMTDGTEASWGRVTTWDPPSRVVFDWRPSDEGPFTEVDVRFSATEGGGTLVDLEHRGWERLGDRAAEAREAYASDTGWGLVFDRAFAQAAGTA
jgi:uncharacterized protein YndB with AHSA1/START domain